MFIPPLVMSRLEKTATFIKNPWLKAPTTVLLTGLCLTFSTPLCCALFPQRAAIELKDLEPKLQEVSRLKSFTSKVFDFSHHPVVLSCRRFKQSSQALQPFTTTKDCKFSTSTCRVNAHSPFSIVAVLNFSFFFSFLFFVSLFRASVFLNSFARWSI